MPKVIPIHAKRTTEEWLSAHGFQKLKGREGKILFKNGELYIEYFKYKDRETWCRMTPMADGTSYYSGVPDELGFNAEYTYMVERHYEYIHGEELKTI